MREHHFPRFHKLKKRTPIEPQSFPDSTLGTLDRTIHLVGWQPDKSSRKVGQQSLEPQPVFEFSSHIGFRLLVRAHEKSPIARAGFAAGAHHLR